jgi:putative transposase
MHLGGVTASPAGEWTVQQARNLAFSPGERLEGTRFLIRDRGPDFTASSGAVFQATGTRILRTAVQAPRMNAICERLAGTLRRELPGRVLILGERHLPRSSSSPMTPTPRWPRPSRAAAASDRSCAGRRLST